MTRKDTNVIGRREELSLLRELIAPPHKESHVLLLLGDPGLGKTVLLAEAAREAKAAGMRVLATTGRESEQDLAFAGLHQLLRPVLDRVGRLATRQAEALRGAFGLSDDPAPPDALLTGIAVLTLLSELSDEQPLLVTADDTQWLDRASLDALAFAVRRLESEQLVLLAGARGNVPPAGFERDLPQLLLRPLTRPDAGLLLDAQPRPPHGRLREQVLTQAVGNPLALIELSRVIATDPDAGRRWTAEPLPLTGQLTALMAAQYVTLPPAARSALLLAAAADSPDLTTAIPGLSADALAPAEAAGLIRLDTPGPRFAHPLTRSAVYHAAPFAERAAAHRQVADALRDQPDRHAWHLAAAALEPDEHLAALLVDSAAQAQRRGGAAAAARALERAAELSPGEPDKARRLLAAAELALPAGQADWVRELAGKVLMLTSDPDLRIAARLDIGWSLLWSNRNADAFDTLLSVAAEASPRLPAIAWQATWMAATVAHQTGLPEVCAKARAALDLLDSRDGPPPTAEDWPAGRADEYRIWIRACTDPFGERADIVPRLRRTAGGSLSDPGTFGAAAWVLDETELAVRVLREALSRLRAPGVRGASGGVLSALEWACVDSGRWDDALAAAREAGDIAAAYKMETVAGSADLTTAIVAAMRGEHDQVAPLLARVRAAVDTSEYRGFAARIWQTAGLAALAQGNYVTAYAQLSRLFAADGTPLHHHFSYLAVADLAAAAVRAERHLEARTLLERALARVDPAPGPRLAQLTARARGLLAEPDSAEAHLAAPLADPTGDTWPFERAQLQLDYGEWLRRQRRINDAKPILVTALETFRHLGAAPWTRRAESELRACGVTVQAPQGAPGALDGLTAQQREIVILAGHGLTNGEIADRLFLSPRTVASHLYRSYPKLGIAGRRQLRDIIDQQITPGAGR
ncbi:MULTISPECIES: LuxR family transcriptional regulator [Streptomyces]|uniref:helix-turn-helix transcriptional regulator n=1 Tax=Streptomyces TaxID=1883 RepID=UPI001163A84C|nr:MULTISPECIES: LuxR family transcriptional regulator [Streptomyces]MCX4615576.1 AAA family ATPase [Streptomyces mirabilis]MCX5356105.1 AAA family ATPase [Streptomyces mirabilis]QDN84620.1 AAA family ATPase [Streptomyces sp. RLB3-6]QDO05485.1 AAA family ATPase [Streptomyces sp. S1D4-23]